MKGWYLHKQRASLQKRKISGACKIQSRLGGKKKKGGGGGREGGEKLTVKKVFLSNTLSRLNCPESFSV